MKHGQTRNPKGRHRRPGGALPSLIAATLRTPLLTNLAPREQEVATIVYLNANITASELESALSSPISNAAIRSMLNRLVAKGVLQRRKGEGKSYFIYSPAVLLPEMQERALERAVGDYFGGSLSEVSRCLVRLMEKKDPQALSALSRQIDAASWGGANTLAAVG
jgi:predicted transcriptional regulator